MEAVRDAAKIEEFKAQSLRKDAHIAALKVYIHIYTNVYMPLRTTSAALKVYIYIHAYVYTHVYMSLKTTLSLRTHTSQHLRYIYTFI